MFRRGKGNSLLEIQKKIWYSFKMLKVLIKWVFTYGRIELGNPSEVKKRLEEQVSDPSEPT